MNQPNFASLINLLGFTLGVALYGWLLLMVLFYRRSKKSGALDRLLLTTAVLGFTWNFGELYIFIRQDFGQGFVSPLLTATAYSALGFLPSVVVYSAWKNAASTGGKFLVTLAFGLSSLAAILNFYAAIAGGVAPSDDALKLLTFGSLALLGGLLAVNFRQAVERKAVWITALLIFTVSAFHLSGDREENSWLVELVAHQSSLPLALAILLQDYRFAFADLFLKRALSLILLTLTALATYVFVAAPLLRYHETHDRNDAQAITLIITLWVATALVYPLLHRASVWFVDKILLRRRDYKILQKEIDAEIENLERADLILSRITKKIGVALTAGRAVWAETKEPNETAFDGEELPNGDAARVDVPTGNQPFYQLRFSDFSGGRRLLSDEIEMLEAVARNAARRIETLRISDERLKQERRHEQIAKLAAEAELRALRAQLNPHFLFNALTTIGYLIQSAPDKAVETLMRLTQLLRGVLRSTGEFVRLGDELKIIESYLEIERARFEERLRVEIEVAPELHGLKIPALILQPLVENAVKHGISNHKKGGVVKIAARVENQNLVIEVADTGAGVSSEKLAETRKIGVGLNNIEQRLASHFGAAARLEIESALQSGTISRIVLPLDAARRGRQK